MKISFLLSPLLACALCIAPSHALPSKSPTQSASPNPPLGFTPLWNGKDLSGWWGATTEDPRNFTKLSPEDFKKKQSASLKDIHENWSISNGELINQGNGLFLTTEKFYANFELLLDYKTVALADSGIYLRGCPQVQIWDSTETEKFPLGADKGSGGLWNNSPGTLGKDPLVKADQPFGQWNKLRIIMVGSRVWVWLNDQQTVNGAYFENYHNRNLPVPASGPIQLQTHGGEIRWRNLLIREIASQESINILRANETSGLESIFNGKDLAGWTGPTDCCRVSNGSIIWQAGKGGTIHTNQSYGNFIARLEFKLPSGGNNGLAIRYPGSGNPAYTGMCESQILAEDYEISSNSKLDPRQTHGSAYGIAAAELGYQNPIGDWNYQVITVINSSIEVELNGTRILKTDLKNIKNFMNNSAHPGKDRTHGHFGLAGHGDAAQFRNLAIKSLD
jgi:hypothetical protein